MLGCTHDTIADLVRTACSSSCAITCFRVGTINTTLTAVAFLSEVARRSRPIACFRNSTHARGNAHLQDDWDHVNGISVSPKEAFNIIKLWLSGPRVFEERGRSGCPPSPGENTGRHVHSLPPTSPTGATIAVALHIVDAALLRATYVDANLVDGRRFLPGAATSSRSGSVPCRHYPGAPPRCQALQRGRSDSSGLSISRRWRGRLPRCLRRLADLHHLLIDFLELCSPSSCVPDLLSDQVPQSLDERAVRGLLSLLFYCSVSRLLYSMRRFMAITGKMPGRQPQRRSLTSECPACTNH
jgi:hypothetical protein